MSPSSNSLVLERQLPLQLGDRLKQLRKVQGLGTVEMARRAGICRTTLRSVESGDPGPAIGTYLRVMSVLGISGELALLAGDALQPGPPGTAAARSKRVRPVVQVTVATDDKCANCEGASCLVARRNRHRYDQKLAWARP